MNDQSFFKDGKNTFFTGNRDVFWGKDISLYLHYIDRINLQGAAIDA